jgi:hypothetical protein
MAVFYRKLFFWIFVLLFLTTTPAAILYSQGFRFDQYKRIFIHSGSITVKSTPSSANIYLNGKLQSSSAFNIINNSTTINGLRPGSYNLKVSADGYGTWEKNVDVHSGVSTEFWNIVLAPQKLSPKELSADGVERYFPSPFGKNVAYVKKNADILEIWSIIRSSNVSALILSQKDFDFSSDALENIEWNTKETLFIVPVEHGGKSDFIVLDSEKGQDPIYLSQIAGFSEMDHVRWSPANQNEIYFVAKPQDDSQDNLYRMNLGTRKPEIILDGIKAYDLSKNSIYFLQQNNIIYKTDLDGKNENQLVLAPIDLSNADEKTRLIAYDDNRQAIVSESGKLYIHNNGETTGDTLKKIADGIKSVQFSNDGKKLLYWSDNEISVLFLRKWDVQPRRDENEIQQVVRLSFPMKNVFWYRDYEHIFFSTQNSVKIIDLDSRDRRATDDIFKYNAESFLSSYDSANGIYYYVDEIKGTKKLFYVYIPAQTNFFGASSQ